MDDARKQVFLSYAKEDVEAARRLRSDLEDLGVNVWFDENAILPGQKWQRAIKTAIREADFFIALLSKKSVSKKGVVQRELREALDVTRDLPEDTVYLIPARLEAVEPTHELLRDLQWVDLFHGWSDGVRRLSLSILSRRASAPGELQAIHMAHLVNVAATAVRDADSDAVVRMTADLADVSILTNEVALDLTIRELISNALRYAGSGRSGELVVALYIRATGDAAFLELTNFALSAEDKVWADDFSTMFRTVVPARQAGVGLWLASKTAQRYGGHVEFRAGTEPMMILRFPIAR